MDATLWLFEREAASRLEALEHAVDPRDAREAAHSLHGLAALAGFATVEQRAAAVERSLGDGDELPAALAEQVSALRAALECSAAGGLSVVLHVDDDATSRRLLAVMLSATEDAWLISAEDSPAALALARRYRPGLILLDLHLRGESGLDVLRRLRSEPGLGETRIVILTAETDPDTTERVLAAGADGYVSKPVEMAALAALLRR